MGKIHQEWYDKKGRKHTLRMGPNGISETIEDPKQEQRGDNTTGDRWHKKPVGLITIGVTVGILVIVIGAILHHFYHSLFSN